MTAGPPDPARAAFLADTFSIAGVLLAFGLIVAAVARFGGANDRVAADQNLFHLPAIRQFAAQWPRPDLSNYSSATAPGYHLLLAAVATYVSGNVVVLRCAGGVFGFAFIGLLAAAARRSAWLALPAAASVYVLTSTVWLLPEDAAWALVTLALLLAMRADGRRLFVGSAIVLATLVFVRQSHAWTIGVFVVGVAMTRLTSVASSGTDNPKSIPNARRQNRSVLAIAIITILTILPAIAVLAVLVALWHGLTPPAFRPGSGIDLPLATKVGGLAPAAPAMVLALIGLFGTPLLAWLWPRQHVGRLIGIGAVVGFVVGVLPATTYSFERRSGIWNLVKMLPTVAGRSPVIVGLATIGGAIAALALARLPTRQRWVLAAALAGFTLTQTAVALVWQRYYEPFVLVWLILAAGTPTDESLSPSRRRLGCAGIAVLTAFQLAVTMYTLRQGG